MKRMLLILGGIVLAGQLLAVVPKIEVQGHRGARSLRPENTLAAFKYALENKIEVLEMDLSYTKDHVLVLNHDETINPTLCLDPQGHKITQKIYIHELTLKEVQKYDCGSLMNPRFPRQVPAPKEKIPTFEEVLALVNSYEKSQNQKYRLNVEIKVHNEFIKKNTPRMVKELIASVKKHKIYDRAVIQAFDIDVIDQARIQDSKIKTAFLIEEKMEDVLLRLNIKSVSDLIKKYKFNILSPNFKVINKEQVKNLQAQGIQVIPWTVNEAKDWQNLIEMEVDGIITDDPVGLKDFLIKKSAQ